MIPQQTRLCHFSIVIYIQTCLSQLLRMITARIQLSQYSQNQFNLKTALGDRYLVKKFQKNLSSFPMSWPTCTSSSLGHTSARRSRRRQVEMRGKRSEKMKKWWKIMPAQTQPPRGKCTRRHSCTWSGRTRQMTSLEWQKYS